MYLKNEKPEKRRGVCGEGDGVQYCGVVVVLFRRVGCLQWFKSLESLSIGSVVRGRAVQEFSVGCAEDVHREVPV